MLYIIPTPIGNIEDISFRAIRILKKSNLILSENTRISKKLLQYYNIKTYIKSYHIFNEYKIIPSLIKKLKKGIKISLISDSGTPCISDPGYLLIKYCIKYNINIQCLPGATAFIPALINSGFPINEFTFIGFLPLKKKRKKKLYFLSKEKRTIILYESPHRIINTLYDLKLFFSSKKKIVICREISKKFEETIRGTIKDMIYHFNIFSPKGEFVIII